MMDGTEPINELFAKDLHPKQELKFIQLIF